MTTALQPKPTQAVSTKTIRGLLQGDAFKEQVAKALPKHLKPDRFIRIALTACMRTPKLNQCDQASFFNALLTLSQLGLEPDGRRAHLIPFENRKRNVTECQLIIDYKGLAELAMRSGVVANIHADVVCENDEFEYDCGEIKRHKIDFRKPRGDVYAAYSICRFKDGTTKADVMGTEEIEAVRKRSRAGNNGPWASDWNEMAKKTVFRRLSKWLPLSAEFRDATEADDEEIVQVTSEPAARGSLVEVVQAFDPEPVDAGEPSGEGEDPAEAAAEAEAGLAPEKPKDEAKPTPQVELKELVEGAGYTFQHFQTWAIQGGSIADADSLTGFRDVKTADATRILRVRQSILKGCEIAKGMEK